MSAGLPPPRADQQYRPTGPQGQVGGAAGVLRARTVIVVGPNGGIFEFSPTVGPGNLIASIAASAGVIAGNAYLQGVWSYQAAGGGYTASGFANGQAKLAQNTTFAGAYSLFGLIGNGGGPSMQFSLAGSDHFLFVGSTWIGSATESIAFLQPSGGDDTPAIANVLNAGGTPWLLPGTFSVKCGDPTLTALGPGQYIYMSGDNNTIVNGQGAGDLFGWTNPNPAYSDGRDEGGGVRGGGTIDGSATTGNSIGIHAGDIGGLAFECRVQHFTAGTASWCYLFDNRKFWTERMNLVKASAKDGGNSPGNGGHVGFTVSGAVTSTASFARVRGEVEITQGNNQQDGLVLINGAHAYDMPGPGLSLTGNCTPGAGATTAAALVIDGVVPAGHPGAGSRSRISNGQFNVGIECSAGANTPLTVRRGNANNSVDSCYGNVNWNSNFTSSGITGSGWKFDGQVQGDPSLGTRRYYGTAPVQNLTGNGQTIQSIVPSAKIPVSAAAAVTGTVLSAGDSDGQLIFVINTGPSGITFAASPGSNLSVNISTLLPPGGKLTLMWDASTALWY